MNQKELAEFVGKHLTEATVAVWIKEEETWMDDDWGEPGDKWICRKDFCVIVGYKVGSEDQRNHFLMVWEDEEYEFPTNIDRHLIRYEAIDLARVGAPDWTPDWVNPNHEEDDPLDYEDLFEQELHHPNNHHQRKTNRLIPKA